MKKLLFAVFTLALVSNVAFAQQQARSYVGPTQNPKTTKKSAPKAKQQNSTARSTGEVYIGYTGNAAPISSGSSNFAGNDKQIHNGVQTSVTLYATKYIGLRGDFSVAYRDQKEAFTVGGPITTVTRRTTIYNVLGGVQIKDNESEAVIQPFGHALVGLGIYRQKLRDCQNPIGTFCGTEFRGQGLAGAFGGGFDVKLARRAGVRFTGDYNPMRIKGETLNNYRFGVGVVFK